MTIVENWSNLSNWFPSTSNAVSGNKLYSNGAAPAGCVYPIAVGADKMLHVSTSITLAGSGNGLVSVGVTQAAPGAPGAPNSVMWGFLNNQIYRYANGTGFPSTGNMLDLYGNGPALPAGTYQVSIVVDERNVSMSILNSAHTVIYGDIVSRSSLGNGSFLGVIIWNSDSRTTSGTYIGPMEMELDFSPYGSFADQGDSDIFTTLSNGEMIRYTIPKDYDPTTPTRLVIYTHGLGGNAHQHYEDTNMANVSRALANAGYIVVGCNDHGNNYGNSSAVADNLLTYQYMIDHYNIGDVYVIGQSMGGLPALNIVSKNQIPNIKALVGIYPITNTSWAYGNSLFTAGINSAYGIDGSHSYSTQTATYDPQTLSASAFRSIPMKLYASTGDNIVSKSQNSDLFAAKVGATVVACSGDHGDPSHFQPSDVVTFFNAH